MTSPIAFLDKNVLMSLLNVAPEKSKELEHIFTEQNISCEFRTDEKNKGFAADTLNKIIFLSHQHLERIWAIAFGYYRFYRAVSQPKVADTTIRVVDLRSTPDLIEAGKLVKWAVETYLLPPNEEHIPSWTADLARPRDVDDKLSDAGCATELYLAASAFILHHELAHQKIVAGSGATLITLLD